MSCRSFLITLTSLYLISTSYTYTFALQTNTYQGVVVTNGQQSYALFLYQCDQMGWSGNATIGFSAAGSFYQNHFLSGTPNAKGVACINSASNTRSNIVYQLSK